MVCTLRDQRPAFFVLFHKSALALACSCCKQKREKKERTQCERCPRSPGVCSSGSRAWG